MELFVIYICLYEYANKYLCTFNDLNVDLRKYYFLYEFLEL